MSTQKTRIIVIVSALAALLLVLGFWLTRSRQSLDGARSEQNRPLPISVIGDGPETLLIMATIHGNESVGTPLLRRLEQWLKSEGKNEVQDRRIVLLPVVNPDGYAADQRTNHNGVDLNRNFPAENRKDRKRFGMKALSERESKWVARVIEHYQPDRLVSIHQPLACVDYDGPGLRLATEMAAACGLPVKKLGARPGSLGAYFGEMQGRPAVTLELPRFVPQDEERLWSRYGPALLVAIRYRER